MINQFLISDAEYLIDGKMYPSMGILGEGGSKTVMGCGDYAVFLPGAGVSPAMWERMMPEEQQIADQIRKLGIETQQFEKKKIIQIDCITKEEKSFDAFVSMSFHALAREKSISILDIKSKKVYGEAFNLYNNNCTNCFDPEWHKTIIQPLLNELVLALTYSVPCYGDGRNYYVEKASSGKPVKYHLFLYDFSSKASASSFYLSKITPTIPDAATLKIELIQIVEDVIGFIPVEEYLAICSDIKTMMTILKKDEAECRQIMDDELTYAKAKKDWDNRVYTNEKDLHAAYPNLDNITYSRRFSRSLISTFIVKEVLNIDQMIEEAILDVKRKMVSFNATSFSRENHQSAMTPVENVSTNQHSTLTNYKAKPHVRRSQVELLVCDSHSFLDKDKGKVMGERKRRPL